MAWFNKGGGGRKAPRETACSLFHEAVGRMDPSFSGHAAYVTRTPEATLEKHAPKGPYVLHLRGEDQFGHPTFLLSLTKSGELQVHTHHPDHQTIAEAVQEHFKDAGFDIKIKYPKH